MSESSRGFNSCLSITRSKVYSTRILSCSILAEKLQSSRAKSLRRLSKTLRIHRSLLRKKPKRPQLKKFQQFLQQLKPRKSQLLSQLAMPKKSPRMERKKMSRLLSQSLKSVSGAFLLKYLATSTDVSFFLSDESVKRKVVDEEASEVPEKRAKTDEVEAVEPAGEEVTA